MSTARIPTQISLTKIISPGTEGGKEFGRVVSLLLLQEAKSKGKEFTIFDDASGDFEGLDSYCCESKSKNAVGYQYKFFPSPLTNAHRQQIVASLDNAIVRSNQLKLTKWIIVTPDDFKNSARRNSGGDASWFEALRQDKASSGLEIEHLGHTKLQNLFLQAPLLSLFYYPNLVPQGAIRAKNIEENRADYDRQMRSRYGRIEFVGMPVYKEDTSRRVPLDEIYIPLSLVGERSSKETDDTPRIDPADLLIPGKRSVVLGDPGSGKSTMLAYLALVGMSSSLQLRGKAQSDDRLTVVVTLRRYADELKSIFNLPLVDYITSVAAADFNLTRINNEFFEYYFQSGRAIVLFDGLDELPSSKFKSVIKDRIESFSNAYPLIALVVTSRIVGYDASLRLEKTYLHYRMAKLRLAEIRQFILDWYSARLDDVSEVQNNSSDLVGVIERPENESIRDLARNPLLLTIVSLVHRIDAVLPDERVVLYQKCTETLLNTWYRAKHREDGPVKGRVERRNRLRIESIAYWMQKQSMDDAGRSVVRHTDLVAYLANYITSKERIREGDDPAEDQADEFLEFIKNAAGLIVEAGDGLYGFIHLTFQEYLSATHLSTSGETKGLQSVWEELGGEIMNPRWREVVRLLVANLKSSEGQQFFLERLLRENESALTKDGTLLLLGLLKDGVVPAEDAAQEVVTQAYGCLMATEAVNDALTVQESLQGWIEKDGGHLGISVNVFDKIFEENDVVGRQRLALIRTGLNLPELSVSQKALVGAASNTRADFLFHAVILKENGSAFDRQFIDDLFASHMVLSSENPESNIVGVTLLALACYCSPNLAPNLLFRAELSLMPWEVSGPRHDHGMNLISAALPYIVNPHPALKRAVAQAFSIKRRIGKRDRHASLSERFINAFAKSANKISTGIAPRERRMVVEHWQKQISHVKLSKRANRSSIQRAAVKTGQAYFGIDLLKDSFFEKIDKNPGFYWSMYCDSALFNTFFSDCIHACTSISTQPLWVNALRVKLKNAVPKFIATYLDSDALRDLELRLTSKDFTSEDLDWAAWLLLLDSWIWCNDGYDEIENSPFFNLSKIVSDISDDRLRIAVAAYMVPHQLNTPDSDFGKLLDEDDGTARSFLSQCGWKMVSQKAKKIPK